MPPTVPGGKRLLAIHCSEAAPFADFTTIIEGRAADLPTERVAIPGGPWWMARAAAASEGRVKRWIAGNITPLQDAASRFLGDADLGEVVLIAHQGCTWYRRSEPKVSPGALVRKQGEDMYRAAEEIRRWATHYVRVSGFIVLQGATGPETKQLFG